MMIPVERLLSARVVPNDFHIALLWLRSVEILRGHSADHLLSELEMPDLFGCYRSPYKA